MNETLDLRERFKNVNIMYGNKTVVVSCVNGGNKLRRVFHHKGKITDELMIKVRNQRDVWYWETSRNNTGLKHISISKVDGNIRFKANIIVGKRTYHKSIILSNNLDVSEVIDSLLTWLSDVTGIRKPLTYDMGKIDKLLNDLGYVGRRTYLILLRYKHQNNYYKYLVRAYDEQDAQLLVYTTLNNGGKILETKTIGSPDNIYDKREIIMEGR